MTARKTSKYNLLSMLGMIFALCIFFSTNAEAATQVATWKALTEKIEGLGAKGSGEFILKPENSNTIYVNNEIMVDKGKKVIITCNSDVIIKRASGYTGDFIKVEDNDEVTELRVRGLNGNAQLIFDGNNDRVTGSFAGIRGKGIIHVDHDVVVRNFYSSLAAGGIFNEATTVLYPGSKFYHNVSDGGGNAVYNSTSKAIIRIKGCDVSGSDNGREDLRIEGSLIFEPNSTSVDYVPVKLQGGIKLEKNSVTNINAKVTLLDNKCPIPIEAYSNDFSDVPLMTVSSKVSGGAASVKSAFKEGKGFGDFFELVYQNNKFYISTIFDMLFIEDNKADTYITGMDKNQPLRLDARYEDLSAIVDSEQFTCSEQGYLDIVKQGKEYHLTGKKYTGPSKKLKCTYTVSNSKRTVKRDVNIIVEKSPHLEIDQMKVGAESKINATKYSSDYEYVDYTWMVSKDGGKTWGNAIGGSGIKSSCYTTPKLTAESENWRYKCTVKLAYQCDKKNETPKGVIILESDIISLASLNKGIPSLRLSDKNANYTGKPITIGEATVAPRTLLGYVDYVYYTDVLLTKKTTKANGATKVGGAPANVGTYYVVANLRETERYRSAQYSFAKLDIVQSKGEVDVKNKTVKMTVNKPMTVALSKNLGNSPYSVKVSKTKLLTAVVKDGKIECTPKKPGICTITIKTTGNKNVTATGTSFDVKIQPERVKIKKASGSGITLKIYLKKNFKYASGYQVQTATDKKFKKDKMHAEVKRKQVKKGKYIQLSKEEMRGKTLYVRVRAYYKTKKTMIFGSWSKTVKTKMK